MEGETLVGHLDHLPPQMELYHIAPDLADWHPQNLKYHQHLQSQLSISWLIQSE